MLDKSGLWEEGQILGHNWAERWRLPEPVKVVDLYTLLQTSTEEDWNSKALS